MRERPILFTPGPTEVHPEVLAAMGRPPISHRGAEVAELVQSILPMARRVFGTAGPVILSCSSASGLMEGTIRNCVPRRSLHLVSGAFGDRWRQIAEDCGRETAVIQVEPGRAITPESVEEVLAGGGVDAVCLTHNETATGVTNPLQAIAAIVRRHPETLLMVDAVSSLGGIPVEVDAHGVDVCFASVQKALALPPGFALASVSSRALERSRGVRGRGYYFDFVRLAECSEKAQPLATPSVSHLFALQVQLARVLKEGLDARYARHAAMARRVQAWARERFAVLAEGGAESNTVTCVVNNRNLKVAHFQDRLRERGFQISNGYGVLKEKTFRIGHMGEHTLESVEKLLKAMDEVLAW